MIIKPIQVKDLEAMAEIEKENFDDAWNFKTLYYEVIKNDRSTFLGVYIDYKLVGYLGYWQVFDNIDIINIAIANKNKRSGIATLLFEDLDVISRNSQAKTITLEVNVNNIAAINLYKKNGFVKVRTIKNYYQKSREDAYMMQKEVLYE